MDIFGFIISFVILWWLVFLPSLNRGVVSENKREGGAAENADPAAPQSIRFMPKIIRTTLIASALTVILALMINFGLAEFLFGGRK